jgi:hypothetical protein
MTEPGKMEKLGSFLIGENSRWSFAHFTFIVLAIFGLVAAFIHWVPPGDYIGAVAAASGLAVVGHGIRHHGNRRS